jgi:hypothetical protein
VRWWPLAIGAFVVELVLYNPPVDEQAWAGSAGPWIWLLTRLTLLAVVLSNLRAHGQFRSPWLIVALGLSLNALVIAANDGYMPQSVQAATEVWGGSPPRPATRLLQNTRPMDSDTQLAWLGDVIAQPTWLPRRNVVSVGDILVSLGIAGWTFQAVSRRPAVARNRAV